MDIKDNQLIQEGYQKNPRAFWNWLIILLVLVFGLMSMQWGLKVLLREQLEESPFTRVTNRDFSLFLWQNPQYMRAFAKQKMGYLPAFQYLGQVSVEPELADELVVAPPDILFLYHTWHRLLSSYSFQRVIEPKEFVQFLAQIEEWQPEFWPAAPKAYLELLNDSDFMQKKDLFNLLPDSVRQAFLGWKNFFKEGQEIQNVALDQRGLELFLKKYPAYGRSYWKNIVSENYLKTLHQEIIPNLETSAFLKQAYYNFIHSDHL